MDSAREAAFTLEAAALEQAGNLNLSRFAFVVVCDTGNLPKGLDQNLESYVNSGGQVLVDARGVDRRDVLHVDEKLGRTACYGGMDRFSHLQVARADRDLAVQLDDLDVADVAHGYRGLHRVCAPFF